MDDWTYRSMREGRLFETWYQRHLEGVVPWEGLQKGDRVVQAVGRALLFKERGEIVGSVVFDFTDEDAAPRRWYDSDLGAYRPMEGLVPTLRAKVDGFLREGVGGRDEAIGGP